MNVSPPESAAGPVLLFDGGCGLCNRVVRLLLRLDTTARLRFAPLQSELAQNFLRAHGLPVNDFETLVFVPDWICRDAPALADRAAPDFLLRTAGAVAALRACGGTGRLLGDLLALVPARLRDAGYRLVARWRYTIFGPWRAGALPRPEWSARFLA